MAGKDSSLSRFCGTDSSTSRFCGFPQQGGEKAIRAVTFGGTGGGNRPPSTRPRGPASRREAPQAPHPASTERNSRTTSSSSSRSGEQVQYRSSPPGRTASHALRRIDRLYPRHPRRPVRAEAPLGVRVPADHPHPRAGRVHKHLVVRPAGGRQRGPGEIVQRGVDARRRRPRHRFAEHADAGRGHVRGDDRRLPPRQSGKVGRLPPGRRAGVQDPVAGGRGKERGDELGPLVHHEPGSLLESGVRMHRRGFPEDDPLRGEAARGRLHPLRGEPRQQPGGARPERVGPHAERRLLQATPGGTPAPPPPPSSVPAPRRGPPGRTAPPPSRAGLPAAGSAGTFPARRIPRSTALTKPAAPPPRAALTAATVSFSAARSGMRV